VFDFPHVFSANAVYNLPFKGGAGHNFAARMFSDMNVSPIMTFRSGIPFSLRFPALANGLPSLDANFATPFAASRNSSRGDAYYTLDLQVRKTLYTSSERRVKIDLIAVGTNILNTVNFNKVWDQFRSPYPIVGGVTTFDPNISPIVTFANGSKANLLSGPFNLKPFVPTTASQLADNPLAFIGVDNPRRLQFAVKVAF